VIFDDRRGWLAIDPKGVVGEIEYEIGAALRNPVDRPDLWASREILQRRIQIFEQALHLDTVRAVRWAFSQAVLSAIWSWEDGEPVDNANSPLLIAREIRASANLRKLAL
jgi:streptomycin 6-kinase